MSVSYIKRLFNDIDRLYAETKSLKVRKLYDDALRILEAAVRERNKVFGKKRPEIEDEIIKKLKHVEEEYRRIYGATPMGLVDKLNAVRETLKKIVDALNDKLRVITAEKESLEAKAKALIRAGRAEEAQIYVPKIAQLEKAIKMIKNYVITLNRAIGRIDALITGISVLNTVSQLLRKDIKLLDGSQLSEYVKNLREARETIEGLESSLAELQQAIDLAREVPSGIFTKDEMSVYQRLLDEVSAEVALPANVKEHIENLKKQLAEKEKEVAELLKT